MDLPEKLLQKFPSVRRKAEKPVKAERPEPMFRTFKVMLFFVSGGTDTVEITVPNKPYWGGS